ncbi:hypothetical protein [Aequorivita xiaoshiensis]|uniref:Uncharacterized protein n=1 Tax=Aequorivita xiaoshiensis TaxID=2874476 RepID=A0A9X1R2C0_9FLAO|nr:hypothetical protein [Aequorivita xiaoshiensis]MCG2431855.1 hypothetical protein [Aequorivita xiaoshiensis]
MEKTITLQKEFEGLISELDRLKTLNEITATNSTNAKNTIDEIKSFITAVEKFKKTIENDYEAKKEDLKNIEKSLKEVIESLNKTKNENTELYLKEQKEFADKSNKIIEKFDSSLKNEIERFKNETEIVKKTIKTHVKAFTEATTKHLSEETLKIQEALTISNEKQNSNFQVIQNDHKDQFTTLKNVLTEIKTSFDREVSDLNELIASNKDSLAKDITLLLEKIEHQNKKVNQTNKIIVIFLVISILLLGVLVFQNF